MEHLKQLVDNLNESSLNLHWVKDQGDIYRVYYNTTRLSCCWKQTSSGYATLCGNDFKLLKEAKKETIECLKASFFTKLEEMKSRHECQAKQETDFSPFEEHTLSVLISLIKEVDDYRAYPFISEYMTLERA